MLNLMIDILITGVFFIPVIWMWVSMCRTEAEHKRRMKEIEEIGKEKP